MYIKHTQKTCIIHINFFKNTCLFDIYFFCVLRGHLEHSLILSTKIRNIKKSSF
ncbi:hypothetical protein FORC61_p016 (plasmid) [Staphylococcus aureus]|nr:hypothetical protein FORC61_p016 [Staphylococcus aureus]